MKLLFICTHNRCRSILAEAIANHVGEGDIVARSAGSSPQGQVHPSSLKALERHSISTQGLRSQSWDDFEDFNADAIITLCDQAAAEACPVWFAEAVSVHWGLNDPSKSDDAAEFDETIDILTDRIRALKAHFQAQPPKPSLKLVLEDIALQVC